MKLKIEVVKPRLELSIEGYPYKIWLYPKDFTITSIKEISKDLAKYFLLVELTYSLIDELKSMSEIDYKSIKVYLNNEVLSSAGFITPFQNLGFKYIDGGVKRTTLEKDYANI